MVSLNKHFAIGILDCFEELLDEKNIDIPSDDRKGDDGEARIYGCEYYDLEQKIMGLLEEFECELRKEYMLFN